MKKIIYGLVIGLILTLTACGETNTTNLTSNTTGEITSKLVTQTTEGLTTEVTSEEATILPTEAPTTLPSQVDITTDTTEYPSIDDEVFYKDTLLLVNQSIYDFSETEMDVYGLESNPGILYVDVETFVTTLDEGLIDFQASYLSGKLLLAFESSSANESRLIWDSENDVIEYNNFHLFEGINALTYQMESDYFDVENTYYYQGLHSGEIDLKLYDMSIEEKDDRIYIPLYLANLFLTGYQIDVYHLNDQLYITSSVYSIEDGLYNQEIENEDDEENIVENSVNYLALLFDHFYGLKTKNQVDSYVQEFEDYGLYNKTTFKTFNEDLQRYLYSVGDLHTNISLFGYGDAETDYIIPFTSDRLYKYQQAFMMQDCHLREDQVVLEEEDDYYRLYINAFTTDTRGLLEEVLVNINPEKDIYIDLSCNGGGYLVTVFEVLAFLTNDPIEYAHMNQHTGDIYRDLITPKENVALDNNFYIYINKATFSAASLFVHLVKENDLAYVFGLQSFGGASSVAWSALPNNLILTYSSNTVLLDKNLETIEDGVLPEYEVDKYDNFENGYEVVSQFYKDLSQVNVESLSAINQIDLEVEVLQEDDAIEFEKYMIEYRDAETNDLLYVHDVLTKDFTFSESIDFDQDRAVLSIKAVFSYQGHTLNQVIFKEVIEE